MPSYTKFQSDNQKYTQNRYDMHNPEFNKTIDTKSKKGAIGFQNNLDKWVEFVSWSRWNADLYYDLITPEKGGIRLDLDQRIYLRALCRFFSVYGVFPRGWSKSYLVALFMYHTAIFYPDIYISLTAQTRENSAKILKEKHNTEVMKHFPLLAHEIVDAKFSKDSAEIFFTSGGKIDNLANHQSSKGARRHRLMIDESALLNNELFEDALEPIPAIPRRTVGSEALVNPEELNGQINFLTTSSFKGTDEFDRNIRMLNDMANLRGQIVLGAGWELPVHYGRGETKSQILAKKENLSPISFAQNWESKWVGSVDGSIVDIKRLLELRVLSKPELKGNKEDEIYLSMDVARSEQISASQSSIAILKVKRNKKNRVTQIKLVNLINLPKGLTFTHQTILLKKIFKQYNAYRAIIDSNTMGSAIIDEALKEQIDPDTNEILKCWDTINTEQEAEMDNAEEVIFDLKSQGINSDILINFADVVEAQILRLLEKKQSVNYNTDRLKHLDEDELPYIQTDFFIEETLNLKLKELSGGKYGIEKVSRKYDKDRFFSVAYGCYYIMKYENDYASEDENTNINDYLLIN